MRNVLFLALLSALVFCVSLGVAFAAEAPTAPIEMKYFPKLQVKFPHAPHIAHKFECQKCHHQWDGQGEIKACGASGCHDSYDKRDKSEKSLYKAIHGRSKDPIACLSCHKLQVKEHKGDRAFKKKMTSCRGSACHP